MAARKLRKPVKLALDMQSQNAIQGGRFSFKSEYKVGFNKNGKITALKVESMVESGFGHDFIGGVSSDFNECLTGTYHIPNFHGVVHALKTNLPQKTAVRSFGQTESQAITEIIIERVAAHLDISPEKVREGTLFWQSAHFSFFAVFSFLVFLTVNMLNKFNCILPTGQYIEGCNAREMYEEIKKTSEFEKRHLEVENFNKNSRFKKRGISVGTIKYALSQNYSAGSTAIVNVNPDGSVVVFHGGCEIGQGIHTKVLQRVAEAFGIDPSLVKVNKN